MTRAPSLLVVIILIATTTTISRILWLSCRSDLIRRIWLWGFSSSAMGGELAMMSHGYGHACGQCLYGTCMVLLQANDVSMH